MAVAQHSALLSLCDPCRSSLISFEKTEDMYLLVVLTAQNLTLAEPAKNRKRVSRLHRRVEHGEALRWLRHLEDRHGFSKLACRFVSRANRDEVASRLWDCCRTLSIPARAKALPEGRLKPTQDSGGTGQGLRLLVNQQSCRGFWAGVPELQRQGEPSSSYRSRYQYEDKLVEHPCDMILRTLQPLLLRRNAPISRHRPGRLRRSP